MILYDLPRRHQIGHPFDTSLCGILALYTSYNFQIPIDKLGYVSL